MDKSELRKIFKNRRLSMRSNDVDKLSSRILENLYKEINKISFKSVHLYQSINNEVIIEPIINDIRCISNDIDMFIPASTKTNNVSHKKIFINENGYDICPEIIYDIEPDIVIVPGIAFDRGMVRLGYGGGFYDKFLQNSKGIKIGVCYKWQVLDKLPVEEHDILMDMIITEDYIVEQKSDTK